MCLLLVWASRAWDIGVLCLVCFGDILLSLHGVYGWVWGGGFQAVKTNGYVCETLVAVAGLSGRFLDLSGAAIGNGSDIASLLTSPSLDGGSVPVSCASNAAAVLANFLRAVAHNQSIAEHKTQSLLLRSIEDGLGGFVRRLLTGAAVGERRTVTAGGISALSVSRTTLGSKSDQPTSLRLRLPSGWDAAAAALEFRLPASFGSDIFGAAIPVVDLELSLHGVAPAAGNRTMVSGLSGLTVAIPQNGTQIVQGLSLPVLITLPLTTQLPASSALVSQFECVFWDSGIYHSKGCRVEGLVIQKSTVTAVVCACTHLTMFSVSFVSDPLGGGLVPVTPTLTTQAGYQTNISSTPAQSIVSVGGIFKVSFNATGAFGLITSYASLLQQSSALQRVLTQSISTALAIATGNGERLAVVIILICWGDQCLSFSNRRDISSPSTALPQMRVDFEVHCASMDSAVLVSSKVGLDVFRLEVAQHMVAMAAGENLGNWSVILSFPRVSQPSPASKSEFQRPIIKYNDSSANVGDGSGVKDIFSQSNSNLQLITGVVVGICAGISILGCCVSRCVLEIRRRKRLKLAPDEILKHRQKSLLDNRNLLIANYPELADDFGHENSDLNEEMENKSANAQDDPGEGDLVHEFGRALPDRSETPMFTRGDPGATASSGDHDLSMQVEVLAQGRRRPPSLTFIQNISSVGESESPSLNLEVSPAAVEKRRGAEVRLKHARTKLANLQRRLDHFIEEAGRQDPARTRLPGVAQAEDEIPTPLASRSGGQPLRDQLNQGDTNLRRSVTLESPSLISSPENSGRSKLMGQNQGKLFLARPSPPDLPQRDALTPVATAGIRSGRLVLSGQSSPLEVISLSLDTNSSASASVAGRHSERLQQLPTPGQSFPTLPLLKPGDGSTPGVIAPLPPSRPPEQIRPRVRHVTSLGSAAGSQPPQ